MPQLMIIITERNLEQQALSQQPIPKILNTKYLCFPEFVGSDLQYIHN